MTRVLFVCLLVAAASASARALAPGVPSPTGAATAARHENEEARAARPARLTGAELGALRAAALPAAEMAAARGAATSMKEMEATEPIIFIILIAVVFVLVVAL